MSSIIKKWEQIALLIIGVILISITFVGYSYITPTNVYFFESSLYVMIALSICIVLTTVYKSIKAKNFSKIYIIIEAAALIILAVHYLYMLRHAAVIENISVEFMFSKGMYWVLLLIPISIILQYFFQTQKPKNNNA